MSKTQDILIEMLTENTGMHFLDSGGTPKYDENGKYIGSSQGYGRQYERNKCRDFLNEKESFLKISPGYNGKPELLVTHSLFHWLNERLDYDEEMNALLDECRENEDCDGLLLMETFPEWLHSRLDEDGEPLFSEPTGLYGEGEPITVNTYNGEELLSQIIQFKYFGNNEGDFVILQIHGGADVRGGYTEPRVFRCDENIGELAIFDYQKATIYCTGRDHHPSTLKKMREQENARKQMSLPGIDGSIEEIDFDNNSEHYWTTDDGHHFYYQGTCGLEARKQLEEYEAKDLDDEDEENPGEWELGVVCFDENGGYCPHCGGKLESSSY